MRGNKPRPDELKALMGEPNKDRYNPNSPKPAKDIPTCPAHLSKEAKLEWRRLTKELFAIGCLSKIDRGALAAYCQAYGRWVRAEQHLTKIEKLSPDQMAFLYRTTNGNLIINPLLSVINKSLDQMKAFLTEFGMTPASRTRITVTPPVNETDPMEDILAEAERAARGE